MLKGDFHLHTKSDFQNEVINYSDEALLDLAAKHNFDVLSFTFHDQCYFPKKLQEYAKKNNILLLPGVEKTIDGYHVLIINYPLADKDKIESISKFSEYRHYLENMKKDDRDALLSVFAHLRSWIVGMGRRTFRANIDLCDAFEYISPYHKLYDLNEDIHRLAIKYNKPLLGNTDMHVSEQFDYTYTLIDAEKQSKAVISAIKTGKVRLVTKPLPTRILWKRFTFEFKPLQQHLKKLLTKK